MTSSTDVSHTRSPAGAELQPAQPWRSVNRVGLRQVLKNNSLRPDRAAANVKNIYPGSPAVLLDPPPSLPVCPPKPPEDSSCSSCPSPQAHCLAAHLLPSGLAEIVLPHFQATFVCVSAGSSAQRWLPQSKGELSQPTAWEARSTNSLWLQHTQSLSHHCWLLELLTTYSPSHKNISPLKRIWGHVGLNDLPLLVSFTFNLSLCFLFYRAFLVPASPSRTPSTLLQALRSFWARYSNLESCPPKLQSPCSNRNSFQQNAASQTSFIALKLSLPPTASRKKRKKTQQKKPTDRPCFLLSFL